MLISVDPYWERTTCTSTLSWCINSPLLVPTHDSAALTSIVWTGWLSFVLDSSLIFSNIGTMGGCYIFPRIPSLTLCNWFNHLDCWVPESALKISQFSPWRVFRRIGVELGGIWLLSLVFSHHSAISTHINISDISTFTPSPINVDILRLYCKMGTGRVVKGGIEIMYCSHHASERWDKQLLIWTTIVSLKKIDKDK